MSFFKKEESMNTIRSRAVMLLVLIIITITANAMTPSRRVNIPDATPAADIRNTPLGSYLPRATTERIRPWHAKRSGFLYPQQRLYDFEGPSATRNLKNSN